MNPIFGYPTNTSALGFRRPVNLATGQGYPPAGVPSPALAGLRMWLRSDSSLWMNSPQQAGSVTAFAMLAQPYLTDQAGRSSGTFFQSSSSSQMRYDDMSKFGQDGTTAPGVPLWYNVGGGGTGYTPPGAFTINNRAFTFAVIGEMLTTRPGQGDDVFFQCGNGSNGKAYIDSTTRRLAYGSGVGGVVSSTLTVYSRRCLMVWAADQTQFRFYLNDQKETAAALTAGVFQITQLPGAPNGAIAVTDMFLWDRALTDDDVYRTLLPYARTRGVTVEFNKTVIFDGDSLTLGFKTSVGRAWTRWLGLGPQVRYANLGLSGITAATLASDVSAKVGTLMPATGRWGLVVWGGTNDIAAGTSGATTYTSLTSYLTNAAALSNPPAWTAIFTPLPRTDVTAGKETERQALVTAINGNAAGYTYTFDGQASAPFNASGTTDPFFTDGIHLVDTGQRLYGSRAAPTVLAAL